MFNVSDVVVLRSGSVPMTVLMIEDEGFFHLGWFDTGPGGLQSIRLPVAAMGGFVKFDESN
jgi:uncharacterized protein YodC (DUF2158 family)